MPAMRRTALSLAVLLTALLASSVVWRPLRPGSAPGPGDSPLAYLRHNLDLPLLDRPTGPPPADRAIAVRPPAADKTAQLRAEKPLQLKPELASLADRPGSGLSDRKAARAAAKA